MNDESSVEVAPVNSEPVKVDCPVVPVVPEVAKEAPLGSFVKGNMGSCWLNYHHRAKECSKCAIMLKCAESTDSMRRRREIAKRPDCTPFEYMISLLGQSRISETMMIDGCLVYMFKNPENGATMLIVVVDNTPDGHGKITITANDYRDPLELSSIDTFEKANDVAKRFVTS
jgi:hypothetical protein